MDCDFKFSVVICGDRAVGKSMLFCLLVGNKPREEYSISIGVDLLTKNLEEHRVKILFWDMAGDRRFEELTYPFVERTDFIIFVYNVKSLESIDKMRSLYNKYKKEGWLKPGVIVGTHFTEHDENLWHVADKFSVKTGMPHFVVNCRTKIGIKGLQSYIEYQAIPPNVAAEQNSKCNVL